MMKSPVLFLIFKREDTTRRVFSRIREARPPKLYISADGPRPDNEKEREQCEATRKVVENIDWPCEVLYLYQDYNLGCGRGVSTAISWFFSNEEEGIIIEDDIIPHVDFFKYCDEMLERYRSDESIQLISGYNTFYDGYESAVPYYKSNGMQIWGWASWRRVWETYKFDVTEISKRKLKKQLYRRLPKLSALYVLSIYDMMSKHLCDTWDYQLWINQLYYGRYSIISFKPFIQNIGIGVQGATHTLERDNKNVNRPYFSPYPLEHPSVIQTDEEADKALFEGGHLYVAPLPYRIIRKIKRIGRKIGRIIRIK